MSNDSKNTSNPAAAADDVDMWARSQQLLIETVAQQLRVAYEASQQAVAAAAPSGTPGLAGAEPLRTALAGSGEAMRDLVRASLQGYEQVLHVADSEFNRLREAMQQGARAATLSVSLVGVRGGVALGRFIVDNPYVVPVRIAFGEPKLISSDGTRRLAADVLFSRCDPGLSSTPGAEFLIGPKSKGRFRIAVPIDSTAIDGRYRGEAQVWMDARSIGHVGIELAVGAPLLSTDVTLVAKPGQPRVRSQSFVVPNPTTQPARISLSHPASFTSEGGVLLPLKEIHLTGDPADAPVAAGQNAACTATVTLPADSPSGAFRSTCVICANDEPIGELTLRVHIP